MTAPPVEADLVVPKGSSWHKQWTLSDPDSGNPLDLTSGYSVQGQVRAWYGSGIVLYEWSETEQNVELTAAGEVKISVPATDSASFEWWEGVYDIELTGPDNEPVRIAAGSILVSPEVTQEATP